MKNIKKISIFALFVTFIFALVACGKTGLGNSSMIINLRFKSRQKN